MTSEENRARLLRGALAQGPGLDGYAFRAALYCRRCGEEIARAIVASIPSWALTDRTEIPADTNDFPQPEFFGESDSAQYCHDCGEYLYGAKPCDCPRCSGHPEPDDE